MEFLRVVVVLCGKHRSWLEFCVLSGVLFSFLFFLLPIHFVSVNKYVCVFVYYEKGFPPEGSEKEVMEGRLFRRWQATWLARAQQKKFLAGKPSRQRESMEWGFRENVIEP